MDCAMNKPLLALLTLAAFAAPAFGETIKLPDDSPYASITIPESWKPEKYDDGVECVSPDKGVYIAVEGIDGDNVKGSVEEAIKYLKKKGVTVKAESQTTKDFKIGDLDAGEIMWDGKDEDGDCIVSLTFVQISPKKGLMAIYWASPESEKKYQSALGKIVRSIKAL